MTWKFVSGLLEDPERIHVGFEQMIEEERGSLHGDPDREARVWLQKLSEIDRKRSSYQDMATEGLITFEELRAKLAELEETRDRAPRGLRRSKSAGSA